MLDVDGKKIKASMPMLNVDDEGVQVDEDEDGDDAPHEVLNPRVGHHDLTNKHGEC